MLTGAFTAYTKQCSGFRRERRDYPKYLCRTKGCGNDGKIEGQQMMELQVTQLDIEIASIDENDCALRRQN